MRTLLSLAAMLYLFTVCHAQITVSVTEIHSTGSSNSTYAEDWFELTNFGAAPVDITDWRMDDNSFLFGNSALMSGITQINPGQSVVFIETSDLGTVGQSFTDAWFGSNIPSGFAIGAYDGSGIGLSSAGDQVNIYDSVGNIIARIQVGVATTGVTFDNAAGQNGIDPPLNTLSQVGVNGAFESLVGNEIGSPGTIAAVPEPSVLLLSSAVLVAVFGSRFFRKPVKKTLVTE